MINIHIQLAINNVNLKITYILVYNIMANVSVAILMDNMDKLMKLIAILTVMLINNKYVAEYGEILFIKLLKHNQEHHHLHNLPQHNKSYQKKMLLIKS